MNSVNVMCCRFYSTKIRLPRCDVVPKKYKGPCYDELLNIRKQNLNPTMATYYRKPLALHQGHKQWLFDIDGRRYLDMYGGICTVSVGHSHPKITEVLTEQVQTLGHVSNVYFTEKIHEYAKRLADTLPGDLKCVYFVNSGSEANDLAVLMARAHTGRYNIFSLMNGYHGMTYQVMEMTSLNTYKFRVPGSAGMYKTIVPDVYNGMWGGENCRDSPVQADRRCSCGTECEAGWKYVEQFKKEVEYLVARKSLAGFWAETIQGVGGIVQFPKNYIQGVREVVKENGGLFISDEVQAGFGRTGDHFWGFEMHGIVPDIVTMAKGIGNGFPLAAVVTTPDIAKSLGLATHFNTFGGNPLACSVGVAVLDIIREERLQENAKVIGTYLLLELAKLREKYEIVGDVRGKGLMIGIELVEEKKSRKALNPEKFMDIFEECRDMGLIIGKGGSHGNVLRCSPPMCITMEDAEFTVAVLDEVLGRITNSF